MLPNWNNAKNISKKNSKTQKTCNYKGKKPEDSKPKLLQLCHLPFVGLEPTNPAVTFALLSLSICPDFDTLLQPGTTGRLPSHLAECSAPSGKACDGCVLSRGTTILGGSKKYS